MESMFSREPAFRRCAGHLSRRILRSSWSLASCFFFLVSGLWPPASGLFAPEPRQFQVTKIDGDPARGALVELSDGQLVIETAGAKTTFESADVRMTRPVDEKSGSKPAGGLIGERRATVWLETIDGSR